MNKNPGKLLSFLHHGTWAFKRVGHSITNLTLNLSQFEIVTDHSQYLGLSYACTILFLQAPFPKVYIPQQTQVTMQGKAHN